jgi:hypothetical protein
MNKLFMVSNGMLLFQTCSLIRLLDLRRLVVEIRNDEVTISEDATKFP